MHDTATPAMLDLSPPAADMQAEVLAAFARRPIVLPSRYLYDERGARLFEQICELPEYYLTRVETELLKGVMPEIAPRLGRRVMVLEPGSGSGQKTRVLLSGLMSPAAYVPIDISRKQLTQNATRLAREFPQVDILPVCADFMREFELPAMDRRVDRQLVFFPGSTIGNFEPPEAVTLLRRLGRLAGPGGAILLGVDLHKDRDVLERAYDDAAGISARFALNFLVRCNRECRAEFDLDRYCYRSIYNETLGRIEMYIESRCEQTVSIAGRRIHLRAGERMRTEVSYKYTPERFSGLARRAGLGRSDMWTDAASYFAMFLFS